MNVEIDLREARRLRLLLDYAAVGDLTKLDRAIARAEALLTPKPWIKVGDWWDRNWLHNSGTIAARVNEKGWQVHARRMRYTTEGPWESVPMASGPETGPEGMRLADVALSAYVRRQGVTLPASWYAP